MTRKTKKPNHILNDAIVYLHLLAILAIAPLALFAFSLRLAGTLLMIPLHVIIRDMNQFNRAHTHSIHGASDLKAINALIKKHETNARKKPTKTRGRSK